MNKQYSREYIHAIDLKGHVPTSHALAFLWAEMSTRYLLPFARIRYALYGQEQEQGLRLDVDKQVFLDSIPDHQEMDAILHKVAPEIVRYLGSVLYKTASQK